MQFNIFKTAAWQLIAKADPMCWMILLGLFIASVFCIAIVAFKYFSFRSERRHLEALVIKMKDVSSFTDLISTSKEFRDGIGGRFLLSALGQLKILLDLASKKKQDGDIDEVMLSHRDIEILESDMVRSVDEIIFEQEKYLPVLSTAAVSSPLVGLFGTIWGLIHSFISISQEKSADIATVAPGLAEALIVTLGGLAVAIPALIAFHYFSTQVRKFDQQLNNIGDRFLIVIKQKFTN